MDDISLELWVFYSRYLLSTSLLWAKQAPFVQINFHYRYWKHKLKFWFCGSYDDYINICHVICSQESVHKEENAKNSPSWSGISFLWMPSHQLFLVKDEECFQHFLIIVARRKLTFIGNTHLATVNENPSGRKPVIDWGTVTLTSVSTRLSCALFSRRSERFGIN